MRIERLGSEPVQRHQRLMFGKIPLERLALKSADDTTCTVSLFVGHLRMESTREADKSNECENNWGEYL